MNKMIRYILTLIVVLVLAVSCKDKQEKPIDPKQAKIIALKQIQDFVSSKDSLIDRKFFRKQVLPMVEKLNDSFPGEFNMLFKITKKTSKSIYDEVFKYQFVDFKEELLRLKIR